MTKFSFPALTTRPPLLDPRRLRICVFGASGAGKTTFAAQFPQHIYFDIDRGSEAVEIRPFPIDVPPDFVAWCGKQRPPIRASRLEWVKSGIVEAIGSWDGNAIIIDTIDAAADLAFEHVCGEFNVSHPDDRPSHKPQIWGRINREVENLIKALRDHSGAVVFVSHETQRDYDSEGNVIGMFDKHQGQVITRYVPSLRERPRLALEKACSIIGRAYVDEKGSRWLYIGDSPRYSTKLRRPASVAGLFPDRVQLSYDALIQPFREAYKQLNKGTAGE